MRKLSKLISTTMISLLLAQPVLAQIGPRSQPGRSQQQAHRRAPQRPTPAPQPQQGGQYYYNGRWVDSNEWQRHNSERDRWANQRRRSGNDNSTSIIAGIIGFALGAAIVGSQQDAQRARSADAQFDARCAKRYRSYDRSSRTYLGTDGARHYCR